MSNIIVNPPTPTGIKALRTGLGLTQRAAAGLAGFGQGVRWSEVERGDQAITPVRWSMFLLATGKHPNFQLAPTSVKVRSSNSL